MSALHYRHLSRERYEVALETDPEAAAGLRSRAAGCARCGEAVAADPLSGLFAAGALPASLEAPVDWHAALRRAIAPAAQPPPRRRPAAWRPLVLIAALAALLLGVAVQAGPAGPRPPPPPAPGPRGPALLCGPPPPPAVPAGRGPGPDPTSVVP